MSLVDRVTTHVHSQIHFSTATITVFPVISCTFVLKSSHHFRTPSSMTGRPLYTDDEERREARKRAKNDYWHRLVDSYMLSGRLLNCGCSNKNRLNAAARLKYHAKKTPETVDGRTRAGRALKQPGEDHEVCVVMLYHCHRHD